MLQNVLVQSKRTRIGFVTMRAFMTLRFVVRQLVTCHISLHRESLMTNVALIRFVFGMRLRVSRQTVLSVELFGTNFTLEQMPGSGVDAFMPAQQV